MNSPHRQHRLARLVADIRACRVCRDAPSGARLAHEPRPVLQVDARARVLVSGQAPGTRVHASGRPFTDPSGDRLRSWMGVDETTFYDPARIAIVPMGFCFPGLNAKGGDLPPRRECAPLWREKLLALMPDVALVLLVGRYAQGWHMPARRPLSDNVRDWRAAPVFANGARVFPLPHPSWRNNAWLRENPWFEEQLLPELRAQIHQALRASVSVSAQRRCR